MRHALVAAAAVVAGLAGCLGADPPSDLAVPIVPDAKPACFKVEVPGPGGGPATIRAMRYGPTDAKVAILLLHGAAVPRQVWTGEGWGDPSLPSALAPELGRAGHAVFVPDRLGYGESPWGGPGVLLDGPAQVATVADMVKALRAGTTGDPGDGACGSSDGAGHERIVLGGHSYGAYLTMRYGIDHGDVDALFPFMFYMAPLGDKIRLHFNACRTEMAPPGYMHMFCAQGDTVSPCVDFMYRPETSTPEVAAAGCGLLFEGHDPVPLAAAAAEWPLLREQIRGIRPDLPVLRGAAEFDDVWEDGEGSAVREQDLGIWRANCPCMVSDLVVPGAGHLWFQHGTAPSVAPAVASWIDANVAP